MKLGKGPPTKEHPQQSASAAARLKLSATDGAKNILLEANRLKISRWGNCSSALSLSWWFVFLILFINSLEPWPIRFICQSVFRVENTRFNPTAFLRLSSQRPIQVIIFSFWPGIFGRDSMGLGIKTTLLIKVSCCQYDKDSPKLILATGVSIITASQVWSCRTRSRLVKRGISSHWPRRIRCLIFDLKLLSRPKTLK